jgi:hypothetical protein
MTHDLKCWPVPFEAVWQGEKRAEFRRDDRTPPFAVGDVLHLHKFVPCGECGAKGLMAPFGKLLTAQWCCPKPHGVYAGRLIRATVTHVLRGEGRFGFPEGYAMLSLDVVQRAGRGVELREVRA